MGSKRVYDMELIQHIALFEKVTGAHVKDAFTMRDRLTFLVQPGEMGKALGKGKKNVEKLEKMLNKKVKIAEYSDDKLQLIQNLLYPLKAVDINEEEGVVTIKGPDTKTKGLMIGARAQNLRELEEVVRKYYEVKEIKVV